MLIRSAPLENTYGQITHDTQDRVTGTGDSYQSRIPISRIPIRVSQKTPHDALTASCAAEK